jgi:NAD(P)-dependent dehydrogenase (short-subunit alcohol dehydrogenase family)
MEASVFIVTGASRGLGLAIARQLRVRGERLLTLARRPAAELDGPGVEQWAVDLADPRPVSARLQAWVAALPRPGLGALVLINNAAVLAAPGPLADADAAELSAAVRVGLEAPLLLTAAFLRASADLQVPRKVLNISSGLGRFALAGSVSYCAAKAGLDHLSRALALEEAARPNGAKVVSLAPGVIDTDMQVQLRGADPARFGEQARFASLKAEGRLDSAEAAAAKVLAFLDRADFGAEPIGDVRNAG